MKQLSLYPLYLVGLLTMALAAFFISLGYTWLPQTAEPAWFVHLIPPVCLMGGAAAVHCHAKGKSGGYLLSYFMNAAGSGWAVGALLGAGGVLPPMELLAVLLPAAVLGLAACLCPSLRADRARKVCALILCALGLVLIGFGVYAWIFRDGLAGCALVFSGLFFLPLPICGVFAGDKPEGAMRYLSFSGFGACFLVVLVVALILSEGEVLSGLDFGDGKKRTKS